MDIPLEYFETVIDWLLAQVGVRRRPALGVMGGSRGGELALLLLSQLTFNQATIVAGKGVAGLTSRILVLEVLAWFVAMGWLALRRA